jgi:hypothetical protein
MRPPGEIRAAILGALSERGPLPLREIAAYKQIGGAACGHTIKNMRRAQVVEIVGFEKRAYCTKYVALYDVVQPDPDVDPRSTVHDGGLVLLGAALNSWR